MILHMCPHGDIEKPDVPPGVEPTSFGSVQTESVKVGKLLAAARKVARDHPERIGPYKLLGPLGEGGMGIVYLAEQQAPIHRRVALKVVKPGMDSKQVISRFETEREALALMNHPHVAKVFDAGTTEQGRPYFVMEYVPGISITQYCDKHRLNTEERLHLFKDVCNAVQHAHQKGIIHRDIKPSNVLVSVDASAAPEPRGFSPRDAAAAGRPAAQVKVIDFGVAKATQRRLTEETMFTEQGQLIGTPGYMSPEQAEMTALDIDTRTDIYSLGVLLYELLTGELPFDSKALREAGLAEIQRIIREVDPPKPSTKLSSLSEPRTSVRADKQAAKERPPDFDPQDSTRPDEPRDPRVSPPKPEPTSNFNEVNKSARAEARGSLAAIAHRRRTEPKTLIRQIRGDLDWIVMKCLEKDRTRRYDTANALASDIVRFLQQQPVLATPPSAGYRLLKLIRRNRGAFAATAGMLATLLVGLVATILQWQRAEGNERRARLSELAAVSALSEAESKAAEAMAAAENERDARRVAQQEKEKLRNLLYRNQIAQADAAFRENNAGKMQDHLQKCPMDLRRWEWGFLMRQSDRSAKTFRIPRIAQRDFLEVVTRRGVSPDGTRIGLGCLDGTVRILNAQTGQDIVNWRMPARPHSASFLEIIGDTFGFTEENFPNAIACLVYSPDGKQLVTGERGGRVTVWNAENAAEIYSVHANGGHLQEAAFAPDGMRLAHGSHEGTFSVWSTGIDGRSPTLAYRKGFCVFPPVRSIAFSPDGQRVALACWRQPIVVFDANTGDEVLTLTNDAHETQSIVFSPDGKQIAGGGSSRTLNIWDAETGLALYRLSGHAGSIFSLAYRNDGQQIASASLDSTLKVWHAKSGEEIVTLRGHTAAVIDVAFSRDGKQILSIGNDGTWKVWNVDCKDEVFTLRGNSLGVTSVAFSKGDRQVTSVGGDNTIRVWDAEDGQQILSHAGGFTAFYRRAAFSPDGAHVVAHHTGMLRVMDLATASVRVSLESSGSLLGFSCLTFSPDGRRIVSGYGNTLTIWDAETGKRLRTLILPLGWPLSISFSQDGKRMVSGSGSYSALGESVVVWDAEAGTEIRRLGPCASVRSVALSPDGQWTASASAKGVAIWNAERGDRHLTLTEEPTSSLAFSPDGTRIVSGSPIGLKLWDTETGDEVLVLRGHSGEVNSVAFSTDGTRIVSGSSDGTVMVWDSRPSFDVAEAGKSDSAMQFEEPEGSKESESMAP